MHLCPDLQEAGLPRFGEVLPQVGDGRRDDGESHLLRGDNAVRSQKVHGLLVEAEIPGTETAPFPVSFSGASVGHQVAEPF